MGTAFDRIDVVCEGEDVLGVSGSPLEGNIQLCLAASLIEVDHLGVKRIALRIQMLYEVDQPSAVLERVLHLR